MNGESNLTKQSFQPVADPKSLISILEERHPQSCFFYNQVVSHDRFKDDITFYTIGTKLDENTWILSNYTREDYGSNISISAPRAIVEGKEQIPLEVKECFSSSNLVNWDGRVLFAALEKRGFPTMILRNAGNVKGNITEIHPCILYYIERENALKIEISPGPDVSELRRLLPDKETEFILSTWKYTNEGSRSVIRNCIAANASAGVFVDGKCVSGVITPGVGLISALYTLKDYRGKGFAKLTMKYAYKEFAMDGCIPCSTVEVRNERSIGFHQSLGVNVSSIVDWIDMRAHLADWVL
ncbi:hypothetical protein Ocin01_10419 [Orchesella cincta]|uniref:N-acetyltransferase domain-containing protein n=1 Tax=Orchesella cincta TaxID=48709 RepID=A0A1D2MT93_ORCCI|nr:hypothetical protein Ocin01_10419 [Orchesella cincta]